MNPGACILDAFGHDGIWNIIVQLNPDGVGREILDWCHEG